MFRKRMVSICLALVAILCIFCGCNFVGSMNGEDTSDDIGSEIVIPDYTESFNDESTDTIIQETYSEETDSPEPIVEINEADFVITDGVLTSYIGANTIVYLPDTVEEIAANAFTYSHIAGNIAEINIGPNVEEISPEAFVGLPSLKQVNVSDANPKYSQIDVFNGSNRDGSSYSSHWVWYKEGINAVIYAEEDFPLHMELNSLPTGSPDEVVTVLCDGAELKISFIETQYTEKYAAKLHSIKYGEQVLDFDEPLPLTGNFMV